MKFKILFLLVTVVSLASTAQITTASNGNWSNPGTWTGGTIPTSADDVTINHEVTIDIGAFCKIMTIGAAGNLINANQTLTVNGNWTNNGTFTHGDGGKVVILDPIGVVLISGTNSFYNLEIGASLFSANTGNLRIDNLLEVNSSFACNAGAGTMVFFADATHNGMLGACTANVSGNYTFMRNVNRGNGWGMYGMPFNKTLDEYAASTNGNMIYSGFTGGVNFPTFTWVNTYTFNETASSYNNGFVAPDNTNNIINRGKGFWYYNTSEVSGGGTVSYDQNWIWNMSGTIDINDFNFGVTYTDNGTPTEDGYNLIANPYPGTIDWEDASWTKTNINDAVYYFKSSNQLAATYVGGVSTNGVNNNLIPAGNAFYVQTNATSPSLVVKKNALSNSNVELKSGNEIPYVLKIKLDGDEIAVRLNGEATEFFDPSYDAYKFVGATNNIFSSPLDDTVMFAINSLPFNTTSVPLFTSKDGELKVTGLESFFDEYEISLEDKLLQTTEVLSGDFIMNYTPSNIGEFENRFTLHFNKLVENLLNTEQVSTPEENIFLSYDTDYINASYSLPNNVSSKFTIATIDGKILNQGVLSGEKGLLKLKRSNSIRLFIVDYNGKKLTYKIL